MSRQNIVGSNGCCSYYSGCQSRLKGVPILVQLDRPVYVFLEFQPFDYGVEFLLFGYGLGPFLLGHGLEFLLAGHGLEFLLYHGLELLPSGYGFEFLLSGPGLEFLLCGLPSEHGLGFPL